MEQPRIVPLRLERYSWRFLRPIFQQIFHASHESRQEALRYVQSGSFALYPQQGGDEHIIPGINASGNISLNITNDIFLLQLFRHQFRAPNEWQQAAYEIAHRQHNLNHRDTLNRPPFVFNPTSSLWVDRQNDANNYFGPERGDPLPAVAAKFRKVAVMLCLRPFNFHYGTEDDWYDQGGEFHRGTQNEDGNWTGGNGNVWNGTNLVEWAYKEVGSWFDDIAYSIYGYGNTDQNGVHELGAFPAADEVYVVVPELGQPDEHHYVFKGTLYPNAGIREFLPWEKAQEETLIYTTKELKAIEQAMHDWVKDDNLSHVYLRELLGGLALPKFKLVIADYEGRKA